jgi:hypothetical protein
MHRMHRHFVRHGVVAALVGAAPLAAQTSIVQSSDGKPTSGTHASMVDLTPYAGYMRFGHYLDGPLNTSLRSANAPVVGAQLGLALSPSLALVGNVAYGSADLQVGLPILGGVDVGTAKNWVYDADLEYRLPAMGTTQALVPFVQAGAGAITTRLESSLLHTNATNAAFNGGAGVDMSFGKGFGARVMVKDYLGRFDASSSTGGLATVRGDWSHNLAGSVGVRLSF